MRLIKLAPKSDECWAHLPALREEILMAGVRFKQKGAPAVVERIVANFAGESLDSYARLPKEQQHTTAVWYIWDDQAGRLRGHLVALTNEWDGEVVVYVYQLWAARPTSGLRDAAFEALQDAAAQELDHYARARGAARIAMYTIRPSRFWRRRFHFTFKRAMYEHELGVAG